MAWYDMIWHGMMLRDDKDNIGRVLVWGVRRGECESWQRPRQRVQTREEGGWMDEKRSNVKEVIGEGSRRKRS
jgi:hypothetical protein